MTSKLFFYSIIIISFVSCFKKKTNTVDNNNKSTVNPTIPTNPNVIIPPTTTPTPGSGNPGPTSPTPDSPPNNGNGSCNANGSPENANQSRTYYRVQVIGSGTPIAGGSSNIIQWSSLFDMTADAQKILVTDSRFRVRAVVKPAPPAGILSKCEFRVRYDSLKFRLRVFGFGQTNPLADFQFEPTSVDDGTYEKCSSIKEISAGDLASVAPITDSTPLSMEVYDVQWDRCNNGYNDPHSSCNYNKVWEKDCFELELQIVTDTTFNFGS